MKNVSPGFVGLIVGLLLVAGVVSAAEDPQVVRLRVADQAEKAQVGRIIDLDEGTRGLNLRGRADAKDLETLTRLGFSYEMVTEHREPVAVTMCTDPNGPPFEPPAAWDCYPTYDQYVDLMNYYASTYPALCELVDFGGTQDGDHRLLALKISDNVGTQENEPEFFYTSSMHGDELTGYLLTLRLADELLSAYATDPEMADLVDTLEIWINPLANPDGTFAGGDHTVTGATRSLSNGHDPNRSFPDPASGDDPDSGMWDPEVQAMLDLADAQSFVMSLNYHGGAEVVNYPWDIWAEGSPDYHPHPDRDWYDRVSHVYADNVQADSPSGYFTSVTSSGVTNGGDWYTIDGGRQDAMNAYYGCRESTIEASDYKTIDSGQLEAHWGYNRQGMLDYMKEARFGIHGLVTNADNGLPVAARVRVLGHDDDAMTTYVYTDPDVGDYHRPIEAGTWDLEFSAQGFETTVVNGVVSIDDTITTQDVVMNPLQSFTVTGVVTDGATAQAIVGATVELTDTNLGSVTTNAGGAYTIPGVWEGSHTLDVTADGYGRYEAPISVTESNTVFDVQLLSIQTAFDEDFETDNGGFSGSGGWQWGEDAAVGAASGTKIWGTVLGGDYGANNADWALDSPEIVLAADLDSAELVFAHWYQIESGWDGGNVQISVDGGGFDVLAPVGGYPDDTVDGLDDQPGFTGSSGGWQPVTVDLGAYIGHSVVVRWRFGTDSSQTSYRGWYIDDVQVLTTGGFVEPPFFEDGFENGDTGGWSETVGD